MNSMLLLCLSLIALPCFANNSPPAAPLEADNEVVERQICTKDRDERVLETLPKEKGCVLQYTKAGKTEEKAQSVRAVQVCQDALKKIAARLEAAGYKCL